MTAALLASHPHRRLNQLTGEWVLVSPHRAKRPWLGKTESLDEPAIPAHHNDCYLCPGNTRTSGIQNPDYPGVYVFDNDFAAILNSSDTLFPEPQSLFNFELVSGRCRVVLFSPRHDLSLPELDLQQLNELVAVWIAEHKSLREIPQIRYIQIFENKGAIMGCSNPHPHGQIWAGDFIPVEIITEDKMQRSYFENCGRSLLSDYLKQEQKAGERIVCSNEHFTVVVPFWAVWPYETLVIPHNQAASIEAMTRAEQASFAAILKEITTRYDNLFGISFPYSSGIHQSPVNGINRNWWHWHVHFYPPLLRSATVKKFMVGYEMLAEAQRDISPETAAAQLSALSGLHYKKRVVCN